MLDIAATKQSYTMMLKSTIAILVTMLTLGCARMAIWSAPPKTPTASRTATAEKADDLFWQTFHAGEYEKIPAVLNALQDAFVENPGDAVTAAHIGWAHVWRLAERARQDAVSATITEDAVLSRRYFEEAVRLNPRDARYLGFYGAMLLSEGTIFKDEKLRRRGYFTLRDSIQVFPEFNYFTAGYTMATLPVDSPRFKEAIEYQWLNLDVCVGEKINRSNPDFSKYMHLETNNGPKRVCWNSWIAPHNFEGFFLNCGDMLVKAGQPQVAVSMYANAKLSSAYGKWPYKETLEDRIRNATKYGAFFREGKLSNAEPRIMSLTHFNCMGCHRQ
jgi:hypothetical protein